MTKTLDHLEALLAAAQEQAKHSDALGPCSLTCVHNAAFVVAVCNAAPELLAVARAAERWNDADCDVMAGVYANVGSGPNGRAAAVEAVAACDALTDALAALDGAGS